MASNDVLRRTLVVRNAKGLHARPATVLARTVGRYDAEVTLARDGQRVDARSVISVLILAAAPGTVLTVEARGPQRHAAMAAVERLFENGFVEE